jgi:phospholipid transport system substrate-binding protein
MRPSATTPALRRRRLLPLLAALPALALPRPGPAAALAAAPEAERFIGALGERTVAVLARPGADGAARVRELAALLDEAVDLELLARLVLGRHWRGASDAQRREYVALFRGYARDSLAARFGGYTGGERFAVTGSRAAGEGDALVGTRIMLGDRTSVAVDWRVREVGGRPMIIDVVAEGVSLLVTNRAEFDSIVNARGMDGLLRQMRAWRDHQAAATPVAGAF